VTYDGLLNGVRVLDLSIWRPGPYTTQLLADLGADVLKLEPPGGDPMRVFPELFAMLNANKRSMELDLKDPVDRSRAHELVAETDVLVEGFRPGVTDRLGMGWDELHAINRALIYCSVSGYGQSGPLANAPGHDLNYQAYAAVLAPAGGEPVECRAPIADLAGGVYGALAVLAAVIGRARTGEGERIDVSMTDILATWVGPFEHTRMADDGPQLNGLPTYGSFETADGRWLTLGVIVEDHFWAPICAVLGLDEYRDLDTIQRLERSAEIRPAVTRAIKERTLDELMDLMADTAAAPSLTRAEMLKLPQLIERGVVNQVTPDGISLMGYPVLFAQRAAQPPGRAPHLAEHQTEGFLPR
jgi:crotonobetainyl-CoA:carnitine CoA-transferase CaiB-like acyl-CoA transferase